MRNAAIFICLIMSHVSFFFGILSVWIGMHDVAACYIGAAIWLRGFVPGSKP